MEEGATTGGAATAAAMNVLVAVDDSDESFHALRWAFAKIFKPKSAAEISTMVVTIAHVVEPLPRYAFPGGHVVESVSKAQEQNGERILSRAFDLCREISLKAKTIILEGDPKDRICRAVEEMNINLLVVGSRGLGQIKRAFLLQPIKQYLFSISTIYCCCKISVLFVNNCGIIRASPKI